MRSIFLLISIICLLALPAWAQDTLSFAWDLSTSEPLGDGGGYRLYASKQSLGYNDPAVGTVLPGVSTITIDTHGFRGRYHFVATAFYGTDGDGAESDWSNEVTFVFRPNPPTNLQKVESVALAPVKAVKWAASLFMPKNELNLRLIE